MNTIELIEDAVAFGGTAPKDRIDEVREFINNLKTKPLNIDSVSGFSADKVHDAYNDGFSDRQENSKNFNIDNYR